MMSTSVIDLTSNQGGDGRLNSPLVQTVMRSNKVNQTGKLFVIIGRVTFSAAMDLSIQLERDTKAIFVGEPAGARVHSIGETNPITLPYSKMAGSIAQYGRRRVIRHPNLDCAASVCAVNFGLSREARSGA
jgi:hypothetical protein